MFSKLTGKTTSNSSASAVAKDINESIKTLSFLARAEKYFDLELEKNGQTSKPLLKIADIIDPLRQIGEAMQKLNKGATVPEAVKFAFNEIEEITQVANDILALNPKGLISSEKVSLSKLGDRLKEARDLIGIQTNSVTAVSDEYFQTPVVSKTPEAPKTESSAEPVPAPQEVERKATFGTIPSVPKAEDPVPFVSEAKQSVELSQPLEWDNIVAEEPKAEEPAPAAKAKEKKSKVVAITKSKKETYSLPQKYFATSYAGMNLQEAAEIISELADNPANLEIIMLEHASRVKPVAEAKEIIPELLAIAPIADSFETGSEITDMKHLSVLKDVERVISACKDLAHINVEGFDSRKKKLFEKFIPHDIKKTIEMAKIAYPEVFSTANSNGEAVAEVLLDFSDIILARAEETGDKLFAELLAQVVCQIVLYSEHNNMRFKFDLVTKKNKLNSDTLPLESRSEVAALRSVTFIPKIARHAQEILMTEDLPPAERETLAKSLDILQLIYVHARDNYSAEIQSFFNNKAA